MLFLVTDKKSTTPGRYIGTGKTNREVIGDVANALISKETLKEFFIPFQYGTGKRIYEAVSSGRARVELVGNKERNLTAINAIDKKTILECSIPHGGAEDIRSIYRDPQIESGIYLLHEEKLIKAEDFSRSVFEDLRVAIIDVFSKLGARQIKITDKTEIGGSTEISLSKEVIALAPHLNLDLKRIARFSIDAKLNGVRTAHNDEFVTDIRKKLKHAPELLKLAEHAALNPGSLIGIEKEINLNIAFGMNANLLSIFQGAFKGGYERIFAVDLSF
uniref:Uncharacterized protein n=1 Tax=Rhizophagus irregularis (strain DAOM 181602 / DAOM 197198 / MUCL 43194) TaxID=747089 RepID=U9TNC6_RHIID